MRSLFLLLCCAGSMIATQPTKVHFRTHEPEALADFSHIEPEALADFSHIDPAALADSCTSHEFG